MIRFGCKVTAAGDIMFGWVLTALFESVWNYITVGGKLNSYKLVKTVFIVRDIFQAR